MNQTEPKNQTFQLTLLGVLLLFLAFGLLPFVPQIRLFNIVWTILFALAGLSVLYYAFVIQRRSLGGDSNSINQDLVQMQMAYEVAYRAIPNCIYGDGAEKRLDDCLADEELGEFLYRTHCAVRGIMAAPEVATHYKTFQGELIENHSYVLFEFPRATLSYNESGILSPYFSCIVRKHSTDSINYFVLGQSPDPKLTTLRSVSRTGVNANLGVGSVPLMNDFIGQIVAYLTNK